MNENNQDEFSLTISKHKEQNQYENPQPVRHPLAKVVINDDKIKINKQLYQIAVNKDNALDLELMRLKYDPYLDQYDYLVGDISSGHLRLKGFFKDIVKTAIDKKQKAIADYLKEYCNPGTPYFVLVLISPRHHYQKPKEKRRNYRYHKRHSFANKGHAFKERRVKKTTFKRKMVAVQKGKGRKHGFVIKKRKEQA